MKLNWASDCQKTYPTESFGGKNSVKGNRHTEPQRGVSERNRRKAAALSAEMGSLSRSITRRSDQNCKIILQILILQFCRQLVKKVQKDFFDKLKAPRLRTGSFFVSGRGMEEKWKLKHTFKYLEFVRVFHKNFKKRQQKVWIRGCIFFCLIVY